MRDFQQGLLREFRDEVGLAISITRQVPFLVRQQPGTVNQ